MPAIVPARLRQQSALLAESFNQPAAYIRSLHHLFEFYADRTHRPGQTGEPQPLLKSYNVRSPVMRQVLHELSPLAEEDPAAGLALCDALWSQDYLEFRLLAASLLGCILPEPPEPVLERVEAWASACQDEPLIKALLSEGLARVRSQQLPALRRLLEEWLTSEELACQRLGLAAMKPLVEDQAFENLPMVFRLLSVLARAAPAPMRPDLVDLVIILARRSPKETAFFLKENLSMPDSLGIPWLIRRCLPAFPEETREGLRASLR